MGITSVLDQSTGRLEGSVESILSIIMKFAVSRSTDRITQLCAEVCTGFQSDGCIIRRATPGAAFPHREIEYVRARAPRVRGNKLHRYLRRPRRNALAVRLLHLDGGLGSAVIAMSAMGELILYRLQPSTYFTEQEAEQVGVLWRSCARCEAFLAPTLPRQEAVAVKFSPRLSDVLACLLDGYAEKEIASRLQISRHTVHIYVKDLYKRLGVNTRSQLLIRCLKEGIRSADENAISIGVRVQNTTAVKLKRGELKPANQIVSPPPPVSPVFGAKTNVFFS